MIRELFYQRHGHIYTGTGRPHRSVLMFYPGTDTQPELVITPITFRFAGLRYSGCCVHCAHAMLTDHSVQCQFHRPWRNSCVRCHQMGLNCFQFPRRHVIMTLMRADANGIYRRVESMRMVLEELTVRCRSQGALSLHLPHVRDIDEQHPEI